MKLLIILSFVFLSLYGEETFLSNHPQWKKLLHYKNGEYKIISKEFFLSSTTNPPLSEELNATLNGLNSSDGHQIACRFPARYTWLRSHIDLPSYDLNKCTDLQKFTNTIPTDEIDIVYKSGKMGSMSGAFGHNYLLFKEKNSSYDSAVSIEATAKVNHNDSLVEYIHNGFSGDYNASYYQEPFYKDLNKVIANNGYFLTYQLSLTQKQTYMLIYHLYELKNMQLPYYYLNGNCTSYLDDLLSISDENEPVHSYFIYPPSDFTLKYSHIITKTGAIAIEDYQIESLQSLDTEEKRHYLEARKLEGNYNTVKKIQWEDYNKTLQPIISNPSTLSLSAYSRKDLNGIALNYSYYDRSIQTHYKMVDQRADLSLLTIGLDMDNHAISLNRFNLIDFNKYSFDEYSSLHFYSGLNRENKDYRLRYENEFGQGLPVRTGDVVTYMTLNGGFENMDFYLKPSIHTYYEFSDNTRIGAGYYHKFIGSDFYQTELIFESKIDTFNFSARYTENNGQEDQRLMLGIGYNF